MLPIHQYRLSGTKPPETSHYVVGRNGLFVRKKMKWVDATVPVAYSHELARVTPSAELLLPRLPVDILAKALKLAKAVYDISKSEVCLLLHYKEGAGYELTVPKQTVDPGRIEYDHACRLSDYLCVGTIHSHGDLPAYHSMTDHEDELEADGVHITLGDVHEFPLFSLSAEMAVNGNRFLIGKEWFDSLIPDKKKFSIDWCGHSSWELPVEWLNAITHQPLQWGLPKSKEEEK